MASTEVPGPTSTPAPIVTAVVDNISAAADTSGPIDGYIGNPSLVNAYANDMLNGVVVTPSTVTGSVVTPATPATPGAPVPALDPLTGNVSVPAGTPAGIYVIQYQICDKLNLTNCAQASITVTVESGLGTLAGTIYEDSNSNGALDPSEPRQGGYTVELFKDGIFVKTTTSNPDGSYTFIDIPPGSGYTISAKSPGGVVVTGKGAFAIAAQDNVANVNLAIDPSGVVYNAVTRLPVAGATLQITTASGTVLPAACLAAPAQQSQVTSSTGQYRFDIAPGMAPECPVGQSEYRITVSSPAGYVPGVATTIPAAAGPLNSVTCPIDATPGGSCEVQAQVTAPALGSTTTYYLSFTIGTGSRDVIHNHIPLDPLPVVPASGLTVEKTAGLRVAHMGDVVPYEIIVRNANIGAAGPLDVIDSLPAGFVYLVNSATVAGVPVEPTIDGRKLSFAGVVVPGSGSVVVTISVRIGTNVTAGEHVNDGYVTDPATGQKISNTAHATLRVAVEPVFDCGDIIGKVFDDKNQSGTQDEGEPGLAGVRVATVKGTLITTDKTGRFSVPCAELPDKDIGSNFILKLDTRTLPTGYQMTTENPRVVRLTAGKASKLNFGAALSKVVRIDLTAKAFTADSAQPKAALVAGVDKLVSQLRQVPSVLRLTYYVSGEDEALATARLKAVEALVQKKWRATGEKKLVIETRVVAKQ